MAHLSLSFLGGFEVTYDAESVTAFGLDKVRALLAYLAVENARPHRREELSAMFWPELSEKKAAHNLSQSLLRLRQALREKEAPARPLFILVTSQNVQFNLCSDCRLDVVRFRELLNQARRHQHTDARNCAICVQWLRQASELYRGDFLAGLFVPDSINFEEWRLVQQEELHGQVLSVLSQLAVYYQQRGETAQVIEVARRQIALEPWREEAQSQLMQALAESGQAAAAQRQYETFRKTLAEELGIQPSVALTSLYQQISMGGQAGQLSEPGQPVFKEAAWLSSQGERRQITALVCGHGIQGDPEEISEQMAACGQHCEGIFLRFGGQRRQRQGDVCQVYFGFPHAFEDAAQRAVHSALEVMAALPEEGQVRIGVHTGLVLVGEKRGSNWQDRDLVGTVMEAARKCQEQARPGELILTEVTRRMVQAFFDTQPTDTTYELGMGQTVGLHRVLGASRSQTRLDWLAQTQRLSLFAGRGEELSRLRAAYQKILEGEGQVILVNGEPGIGKSRLIWEFMQNLDLAGESSGRSAIQWLSSRCLPFDQNTNLYPLIGLLEQLLGFQAGDSPEARLEKLSQGLAQYKLNHPSAAWLLSLLLGLPTGSSPSEVISPAQRQQMCDLFLALVRKRAAIQPLGLLIEDMHWSDPSTVEWLGQSISSLAAIPCLTLLTARPGFQPAWLSEPSVRAHTLSILLSPLDSAQARVIVTHLAGEHSLNEDVVQQIVSHTDGVPLFIEEVTKTLLEGPAAVNPAHTRVEIPGTLIDSLAARLDHLGAAKETAQWAAVFGREFSYAVLQACVPYDGPRLQGNLAHLIAAELVIPVQARAQDIAPYLATRPDDRATVRYAFKHALVQEAAYSSLLKRTRQVYHRRIAEMLETRFQQVVETRPEVLAQHYEGAGMKTQAMDYWLRAGELAIAQGAIPEARNFYERSLDGIPANDRERRWQALLGWEKVLSLLGEHGPRREAIEALLEVAGALESDEKRAIGFNRLYSYAIRIADQLLMESASQSGIEAARRAGDLDLEIKARVTLLQTLAIQTKPDQTHRMAEEIFSILPDITNRATQSMVLTGLAFYYSHQGDLSHSIKLNRESVEIARRMRLHRRVSTIEINLGFWLIQLGRYPEARTIIEEGLALAEAIGDKDTQVVHRTHLTYACWRGGDRLQALSSGARALDDLRATVNRPMYLAECLTYLGLVHEEAGDWTTASAYAAEAAGVYGKLNALFHRVEANIIEAHCRLALGQADLALRLASEGWEFLRQSGGAGLVFPARAYLYLSDVFSALKPAGITEKEVIEVGYLLLIANAEKISDPDCRKSYLEEALENRALIERWRQIHPD